MYRKAEKAVQPLFCERLMSYYEQVIIELNNLNQLEFTCRATMVGGWEWPFTSAIFEAAKRTASRQY